MTSRGFTLLEVLVSVVLLTLVVIGVYFMFDQGQWLYLESERKSKIQETARLTVEQMERDFRMIGSGVPTGTGPGGAVWTPFIFTASAFTIGFTGDLDNGSDNLSRDVGVVDNQHIFLGEPSKYFESFDADANHILDIPVPIVLVSNKRKWENLIAITLDSNDTAIVTSTDVATPADFKAVDSTVHTLERVFYRMVDQAGNLEDDGVCTDPFPYCSIQRQEFQTNNPAETDPETESANAPWETIARNVTFLRFTYLQADGVTVVTPGVDPLSNIDKIRIKLIVRDRSRRAGIPQDSVMKSEVLIRNERL
jgi:prepilin-type N-terminal cleavage/methylation domain-containing protein